MVWIVRNFRMMSQSEKRPDRPLVSRMKKYLWGILENLWGSHPPFQIDANFGGTAGVAEMLLQSHEGYIEPLPAIPDTWKEGQFKGLVARGNFEVSARWKNHEVKQITVLSNMGEECCIKCPKDKKVQIHDSQGRKIKFHQTTSCVVSFKTRNGYLYTVSFE